VTPNLTSFLEMNLGSGKSGKDEKGAKIDKAKVRVGVSDVKLATAISDAVGVKCDTSEMAQEMLRYCHSQSHANEHACIRLSHRR
jgi:hypothetical protein